jgi:hypothetical protein
MDLTKTLQQTFEMKFSTWYGEETIYKQVYPEGTDIYRMIDDFKKFLSVVYNHEIVEKIFTEGEY